MFTHVYFGSNDLAKSKAFYDAALGALGYGAQPFGDIGYVYPSEGGALVIAPPADGQPATFANGHTLGLGAANYDAVDAFHAAGIAAGGSSEGAPGFRPNSPGNMYGAYLRDPDGNKICAYAPNVGPRD
ncbi:VOC family protein [Novosphingobium mangrovi (ex Hu et al. 2023)]|uniref:VOC family protein n=1 Tax=Novosphingobium mangrovi (ex Hu et al. 2023) TaxID=2930094 RepID=A0ABT0ACW6_9SPHN|nr:VOC family protein [Novosphingobium mangrovi (ex Hu et al. 2023)]MCJ1961043.1 VOC family protein [Novosphingobium mangrovi (ex Hu et al. 2023)]